MKAEMRKVTVSLPADLVEFADRLAAQIRTSRSQVISRALAVIQAQEEEKLAIAGYRFYADDAVDFAQASAQAVYEARSSMPAEAHNGETW